MAAVEASDAAVVSDFVLGKKRITALAYCFFLFGASSAEGRHLFDPRAAGLGSSFRFSGCPHVRFLSVGLPSCESAIGVTYIAVYPDAAHLRGPARLGEPARHPLAVAHDTLYLLGPSLPA